MVLTMALAELLIVKPFSHAASEPQENLEGRAFLVMTAEKAEAYPNEKVPLTIKLFTQGGSVRDVRYPQFSHEGLSAEDLSVPAQVVEKINGIPYDTTEFRTYVSGGKPGRFRLGPAEVRFNLLSPSSGDAFSAFFGGQETREVDLKSEETSLTIVPFPQKGKPSGFTGAVGTFDFDVEAHPCEVLAGDPVSLKITIRGKGSFNTVNCPEIQSGDGFRAYAPQVFKEGGALICEQVLLPLAETVKEIPSVGFSFFDPEKRSYRTLTRGPIALHVIKEVKQKAEDSADANKQLTDWSLQKQRSRGQLHRNYLLLSLCALLLLFLLVPRKQKERIGNAVRAYRSRLDAAKQLRGKLKVAQQLMHRGDALEFYTAVFRALQWYIGYTLTIPPAGIAADIVDKALISKGIDEDTLKKITTVFDQCDRVRYAYLQSDRQEMETTLDMLRNITKHLKAEV
ncbi:MAG: protein BatD [Nitrospirales bacterium]|nr:protein BatD [Nitrospirales bacterium]